MQQRIHEAKSKLKVMTYSLKTVFRHPTYTIVAILVALFLLLLAIWLPNLTFLRHVADSDTYSLSAKLNIYWTSIGFLKTNFTVLTRTFTIIVVALSGINIAMLTFYIRNRIKLEKAAGIGIVGTAAGLLGVGCTSCGSVILSSIIGIGASNSFLGFFPLKGAEFGILGTIIILFSIYLIAHKIKNPNLCKIT